MRAAVWVHDKRDRLRLPRNIVHREREVTGDFQAVPRFVANGRRSRQRAGRPDPDTPS